MARLRQIAPELPSADLNKAVAYYQQKLGFKVALRLAGSEYAIVEHDGVAVHLFAVGGSKPPTAGVHILTSDLGQLYAEFEPSGVTITQGLELKPWGKREFRARDDRGHARKITEPLEDDAA